jgi:hypothetical protein
MYQESPQPPLAVPCPTNELPAAYVLKSSWAITAAAAGAAIAAAIATARAKVRRNFRCGRMVAHKTPPTAPAFAKTDPRTLESPKQELPHRMTYLQQFKRDL